MDWTALLFGVGLSLFLGLLVVQVALLIVHPPFTRDWRQRVRARRSLRRPKYDLAMTVLVCSLVLLALGTAYLDRTSLTKSVGFILMVVVISSQIVKVRDTIRVNRAMREGP